jgi:hypothetical protein
VRELLLETTDSRYDLESFAPAASGGCPATPPANFVEAQADVLAVLAEERHLGGPSERARKALGTYDQLMRRDVITPLQTWALASGDPVVQAAGFELGEVSVMLRRMSVALHDLQGEHLQGRPGLEARIDKLLQQYLQLVGRFAQLLHSLSTWRRAR